MTLEDAGTDKAVTDQFDRFLKGLRDNLNDAVSRSDAINMLSQHLITKPVFDALFAGHDFATHNPVSRVMQAMVEALDGTGLESETERLGKFYDSVRLRAEQVVSADGKQHLIADLYEKFFRTAFKKQSEALGIVYTPVEVVDFILRAADHAIRKHLGMSAAYVSEFVNGRTVFRHVDAPGLEHLIKDGDVYDADELYCLNILDGKLPELIPNTSLFQAASSMPITQTLRIGAHMGIPI